MINNNLLNDYLRTSLRAEVLKTEYHTDRHPLSVEKTLPLNINLTSPWATLHSTSILTATTSSSSSTTPSLPSGFFPSLNEEPTILDSNGNSPLTSAVFSNDFSAARNLIEHHNLPLNLQNYEGETALSYAVMNSNYEMVKFLIDRGADLNTQNCRSETPLHQAVVIGNLEIARGLAEGGGYIDAEDECGETPLHFAVREDQAEIVEYLLSVGADPDHSNHDDETPAELAEMVASDAVKKVFLDNCKRYVDGKGWNSIQNILGSKSHLLLQKSQKKLTSSSLLSPLSLSCNIPIRPHL